MSPVRVKFRFKYYRMLDGKNLTLIGLVLNSGTFSIRRLNSSLFCTRLLLKSKIGAVVFFFTNFLMFHYKKSKSGPANTRFSTLSLFIFINGLTSPYRIHLQMFMCNMLPVNGIYL
uniref:Uncharacterized protein n=1 Tax=Glossina brevipalpis TaxID=37001 RepID=A0A1A9WDZ2_9MUSC